MLNGKSSKTKLRWQFGIIAGIFLMVFALYPQLKLWNARGGDWQGHYAYNDIDEVAYAAYLKALIDGRPRKNDPIHGTRRHAGESAARIAFFDSVRRALYGCNFGADFWNFRADGDDNGRRGSRISRRARHFLADRNDYERFGFCNGGKPRGFVRGCACRR